MLEDDAADLEIRMLVSEADFLLAERRVEIRIVVDLAWATDAGVESLLGPAFALQVVRVEQIASLFGEGQAAFVLAKVDGLDQAFVAEVADGIVVAVEVLFGHHSERADGCQRATILAIQLVHTVPIDNELAFLASRQIEVPHQGVARIVITPVAVLVHARRSSSRSRSPYSRESFHRASDIGPPLRTARAGWLSVKTPWQYLRRAVQGSVEAPGRVAAAISAWSEANPGSRL